MAGDHDESKPQIPHRIVFTHQDDLLDCSNLASKSTLRQLFNLAENAKATINAYARIWPNLQFILINQTEPDLIQCFESLPGMHKANLCRAADLTLHGGYYFDGDILVVQPYKTPADAKFITVKGAGFPKYGLFQACGEGLRHSLSESKSYAGSAIGQKTARRVSWPHSIDGAWMEVENITNASSASYVLNNVHLLNEVHLHSPSEVSKHPKLSDALASTIGFNLIHRIPRGYGNDCQFQEGAHNFVALD